MVARLRRLTPWLTAEQVEELRLCVPELPIDNILIEPLGRNTAPCIGLAAVAVRRRDPQGVMAVLPSDHFVADEASFMRTLTGALACAAAGHIVTLGIRPTHPETGYGYIQLGGSDTPDSAGPHKDDKGEPIWRAAAFVEKPTAARARDYLQAGNYVWNSGTFFFPAQRILAELHRHLPALGAILDDIAENPAHTAVRYPEAPSISIDYAVMERLGEELVGPAAAIRVLSGDFGWNDVGSFAAVPLLHPADAQQNHIVRAARDPREGHRRGRERVRRRGAAVREDRVAHEEASPETCGVIEALTVLRSRATAGSPGRSLAGRAAPGAPQPAQRFVVGRHVHRLHPRQGGSGGFK